MKVFIAGLTGTGKNTVAKAVAKKFKLKNYESSVLFKDYVGRDFRTNGYWGKSTKDILKTRIDSDIDEKFDKHLFNIIDMTDEFVVDSWTMPWLYKEEALRVLLTCPFDIRVKRVMGRDNQNFEDTKKVVKEKDIISKMVYLQKYGFDITKDINIFDLIVNTRYLNGNDISKYVCDYVKKYKEFFE